MDATPRLLIVDDEAPICRSCERIFEAQGFHVASATDPERGLALATQEHFDTILLDMKMPNMDGLRFLQRLRESGSASPVIVITGYASVDTAARFMRLGAVDYVAKPFTPAEISAAVARLVSPPQPARAVEPEPEASEGVLFHGRSWLRVAMDGSVLVGAWLDHGLRGQRALVSMAQPGERLVRGLPWASLSLPDGRCLGLPSPVDGVVVARREDGGWEQGALGSWLLRVRPLALDRDLEQLAPREASVVHRDPCQAERQVERLEAHGFEVSAAASVAEALERGAPGLLLLDARSVEPAELRAAGPLPETTVVLVEGEGSPAGRLAWRLAGAHEVMARLDDSAIEAAAAAGIVGERPAEVPAREPLPAARLQHLVRGVGAQARSLWIADGCVAADGLLGRALVRSLGARVPLSVHHGAGVLVLDTLRGERPVVLVRDPELRPGAVVRRGGGSVLDGLPGLAGREVLVLAVGSMVPGSCLELDAVSAERLSAWIRGLLEA